MNYDVNAYNNDEEIRRPKIIRHWPNYFEEYDVHPSKHNVTCNIYVSCNFLLNNV